MVGCPALSYVVMERSEKEGTLNHTGGKVTYVLLAGLTGKDTEREFAAHLLKQQGIAVFPIAIGGEEVAKACHSIVGGIECTILPPADGGAAVGYCRPDVSGVGLVFSPTRDILRLLCRSNIPFVTFGDEMTIVDIARQSRRTSAAVLPPESTGEEVTNAIRMVSLRRKERGRIFLQEDLKKQ